MTLKHTWLPASAPDGVQPLQIIKAEGSHLITATGSRIYDAIASWWCKPLGHCHPLVQQSICEQLNFFEQHIPANTYNHTIEELSSRLCGIFSSLDKVMYASDGSSAVEIALKLSYESRVISGQSERNKFMSLNGGYHGETLFTLSVCGINSYKTAYINLLSENYFIDDIVYVNSRHDPLWDNCNFNLAKYSALFAKIGKQVTALIIEPIVQGAGGIKIISRDWLQQLIQLAKKHDIHLICDEIMVGLGRLGCYSVSKEFLAIEPDFVCFAKNLTAGSIPMSAVLIHQDITQLFREQQRIFPHSHTHSCNALAARVALSYLDWLAGWLESNQTTIIEEQLLIFMQKLATEFSFIRNPRAIGIIAACDLELNPAKLAQIFELAIMQEIYIRPIGNCLYLMPPIYNLTEDLSEIKNKLYLLMAKISTL